MLCWSIAVMLTSVYFSCGEGGFLDLHHPDWARHASLFVYVFILKSANAQRNAFSDLGWTSILDLRSQVYLQYLEFNWACLDKTHIRQFWYTIISFRPEKYTKKYDKISKISRNGPKYCILCAKQYTVLKKVHHRRCCGTHYYELCGHHSQLMRCFWSF